MFRLLAPGAGNRLKNPRILGVNHSKVKPQLRRNIPIFPHSSPQLDPPGLTTHAHVQEHLDMNPDYSRAIPDAWRDMSRVFTALGDEHRQRIQLTFERGERKDFLSETFARTREYLDLYL
jgi:hypothetical protein